MRRLREGSVSPVALGRWLTQLYYFDELMMRFQLGILRQAPREHRVLLAQIVLNMVEEMDWLLSQGIDLSEPPHPSRQSYQAFFQDLQCLPYPHLTVMHWATHQVFMDALKTIDAPDERLQVILERWADGGFGAVLYDLAVLADEALEHLDLSELDAPLNRLFDLEDSSWEMALRIAEEADQSS
ncbi:hypothetical protein [Calidithermus timidus]|uniref:hypothetical protein n=1 Tax=Calidithermus timidus TaxID=307124 RepID=UPI0014614E1C|nr:hypothetical protein [Calidithermus timidus]